MIEIYKWLYKCQDEILYKIEETYKIRALSSFINIADAPGALGTFRPEIVNIDNTQVDLITLTPDLFTVGDVAVLKVLAHEILHGLEKIEDFLAVDHGVKFRMREELLHKWVDKHTFPDMPKISFSRGGEFVAARGVLKYLSYQCLCGTRIHNTQELDIRCNKCGHVFFLVNDGREDFREALRLRTQPLVMTAAMLRKATDAQILKYASFGLADQLQKICEPIMSETVTNETLDDDYVSARVKKLHRVAVNFAALEGVETKDRNVRRIAHLLVGGG